MGRVLGMVVLAAAVFFALLAAAGWYSVTQRDGQVADAREQERVATIQVMALTKQQSTLQTSLADTQQQLVATQKQLAAAIAPPPPPSNEALILQTKVTEANTRLDAATAKIKAAEQTEKAAHATLSSQAKTSATPEPTRPAPASTPVGTNGLVPNNKSGPAPTLPSPGLPPDASAHDYLVAARAAIETGQLGEAQSALERAEVKLLNETQLATPRGLGGHPGIEAIEQALDHLGVGDKAAASAAIERQLAAQSQ